MAVSVQLGKIEKVDLREVWEHEAKHFTPWLSENLHLLGNELGFDLELQAKEASVGSFSLDLLARETGTDRQVVIENQLEDTDHDHLGKLLTYASEYDGKIVVWISRKFKDEHRNALDWLNRRTGKDTGFFGVVVELLKINDSPPAPHFNVILAPKDWSKSTASGNKGTIPSNRMERYRKFFKPLLDTLREKHEFTDAKKAQPANWHYFATGVSGFKYSATISSADRARVALHINGGSKEENKHRFDMLDKHKDDIESTLEPLELEWEPLDHRKACRIAVSCRGSIDDNEETLEGIRGWMIDNLLKFKDVWGPRIVKLRNVG